MIGIISTEEDVHARSVRQHLDARGAAHVTLDTSRIPVRVGLTTTQQQHDAWDGTWTDAVDGPLRLRDLRAMWWRRPQPFVLSDEVRGGTDRGFVRGECAAMLAGIWSAIDAEWVNDPDLDEAASRKMWQLQLAARLGLRVPRTCMTNDPAEARRFIDAERRSVIFKSFSATPETWRETRPVRDEDLAGLDHVRLAPVIFQELVPGGVDIRVTVVGDRVFAAEIRPGESAYEFDFRVDPNPTIRPYVLPAPVEKRLLRLMERLRLRYGAADFRLAPDGDLVFLEVNPAGQWLFVEVATGQPISAALAELLQRMDRRMDRRLDRRLDQRTPA